MNTRKSDPSPEQQVIEAIQTLAECFRKEPNQTQVRIFVRLLAPYAGECLERAMAQHIESSNWFPTAHELLGHCRKIAAENEVQYQVDPLMAEYFELTEKFYQSGAYIPQEFEALEAKFRNKDRTCMADQVKERARRLESIDQQMAAFEIDA